MSTSRKHRTRRKKRGGCPPDRSDCGSGNASATSLREIVDDYIRCFREHAAQEREYFAKGDRDEAISRATLAEVERDGRKGRHSHQYRIPRKQLEAARDHLLSADLAVESFDELHQRVAEAIGSIERIGELAVYDTAHRIGAFLGIEPELVYLHRGTRDGARELGLGRGRKSLRVDELPAEFSRLRPYEIEDCLCIYKSELGKLAPRNQRTGSAKTPREG